MPYVRGYEPDPDPPKAEIFGYLLPEGGAQLIAIRNRRRYVRKVTPHGLVSLQEAAALVHRRDPVTGELRPVSRIALYRWATDGKIPTVRTALRPGTRLVTQVKLSALVRFARAHGYEFRPADEAAE